MILAASAARYTRVPPGSTTTFIAGGTIKVFGIVFTSTANANATLFESDGVTVIATIRTLNGASFELKAGFIADKGLKITTDANMECTVFHSNVGA